MPPAIRTALVARLRERFAEIEAAVFSRVRSVSEQAGDGDPEYLAGLRAAVVAAVEYGLSGIEFGDEDVSAPPSPAAAAQARRAARNGVELDTVLRRYAAGDRLLGEFILNEADHFPAQVLQAVLREQGPRLDRLMAAVSTDYLHEQAKNRRSPSMLVAENVEHLLADDGLARVQGLNYIFDAWHLGVIVKGAKAEETVRLMAVGLDRKALSIPRGDEVVWAWLGGRHPLAIADVEHFLLAGVPADVSLAIGEPRKGIDGWRLTHHEARAALQVMQHLPKRLTRGTDVLLLVAVLRDEKLAESLLETYIRPLGEGNLGGALRRTLRTYIDTGGNAASTAVVLAVDRSTVQRHLRKIEERLGRGLHTCNAELKVALEFDELTSGRKAGIAHPLTSG